MECGALDGVRYSNTLFFERYRNWTGLLIEANPTSFKQLLKVGRNAFSSNVCLSPTNKTGRLDFIPSSAVGGLSDTMEPAHYKTWIKPLNKKKEPLKITVQCFPLYSMLLAVGRTHIDYFSLDVEGAELEILRTIPFEKVTIDILTIEYAVSRDPAATSRKLYKIRELFRRTGLYREIGFVQHLDIVFKRLESN